MTNPDQEFFQFLTEEGNLKGLIVAKNQFPIVRDKLIVNFWDQVRDKLIIGLKKQPQWEVKLESNIYHQHAKLFIFLKGSHIYKNHLPSIIFCFQRLTEKYPYLGFWINEQTNEYKTDRVKEYVASIHQEHFSEFKGFDDWWLIWEGLESFDLSNEFKLLEIIPTKAEEKAEDFANRLIDLFERVLPHLAVINERYKIQKI